MSRLSLSLFGPIEVQLDGKTLSSFRYDKVRALLCYLAVESDRLHRREALMGLFWPDAPEEAARTNLRQALSSLRASIADREAVPPFLSVTREGVQWNQDSTTILDVSDFVDLIEACARHTHRRQAQCKACAQRLEEAARLYRGDFLAQFFLPDSTAFEEWAVVQREALQQKMLAALSQLIQYYEQRGDYERAEVHARRYLELQPWSEEMHRQLMRLLVLQNQRSAALVQYERCKSLLARELGVEPEPETTSLYEQIGTHALETDGEASDLRFLAGQRNNLPPQLTPFVGREAELAQLSAILDDPSCRLVTITGPGGIGKTCLAIQAAQQQADTFPDGVCFVPLSTVSSPDLIPSAILSALQMPLAEGDVDTQLSACLQDKEILLVLDNFEHLLGGGPCLSKIFSCSPGVVILATSRERLKLKGETVLAISGLPFPAAEQADHIPDYAAIELLVRSARRALPGFILQEADMASAARICRLLDGIPLAIEIAAAWVSLLSLPEIAQEIAHDLDFLTSRVQDLPDQHRSLRAVFDRSWGLLDQGERAAFQRLSVLRGGFQRKAAEAVAGANLSILAALLDKSLIQREPSGRYKCHELAAQYAFQKLSTAGEVEQTYSRLLDYCIQMTELAQSELEGEHGPEWLKSLEEEYANFRTALDWSVERGDSHRGLRLATSLFRFWYWHNHHMQEGSRWLEALLERASSQEPPDRALRAKGLHAAGVLAMEQGDTARGVRHIEEGLAIRRQLGDTPGQAASLNSLGAAAWERGDFPAAQALFTESLALRRQSGQRASLSVPLMNLGKVAQALGEFEKARALFEEGLEIDREFQNQGGTAIGLSSLAWIYLLKDQPDRAQKLLLESLALRVAMDEQDGIAYCLEGLAAAAAWEEATPETARTAARLSGAAGALRQAIHVPLSEQEAVELAASLEPVRSALGPDAYQAACLEGQKMGLKAALEMVQISFQSH